VEVPERERDKGRIGKNEKLISSKRAIRIAKTFDCLPPEQAKQEASQATHIWV